MDHSNTGTHSDDIAKADLQSQSQAPSGDSSDRVTQKVIILQLIDSFPDLTYDELMQLALGTMYMDYFTFATLFPELQNSQLIRLRARKEEKRLDLDGHPLKRLELTQAGRAILETMAPSLPTAIRRFLDEAKGVQRDSLRQQREVEATYTPSPARGFDVTLALLEDSHDLFRLRLEVPSEQTARTLIHRWKTDPGPLYVSILKLLNGETDPSASSHEN